jgi:hypothetical protein
MRSAPLSLDQSQERVEAMMEQGTAFSDVAWSLRDVEQQRQDARLTLSAVGAGELGGW